MENNIDIKTAELELEKRRSEAETLLKNKDKLEEFLLQLEEKLKIIPVAGNRLSNATVLASLLNSYVKKEYTKIPLGTVVAILSALIYFVSPLDIVPDSIPALGYIDDAAVISVCWKLVESDVEEYKIWRQNNK